MKSGVKVLIVCSIVSNAWVCVASDGFAGKQCAVFSHCTAEQEAAATQEICGGGERAVDGGAVTTTTTVSAETTSTTVEAYGHPVDYLRDCRWYSKSGKRYKHCFVSGYLSAQCGGGHTRRDGSVSFTHCVVHQ